MCEAVEACASARLTARPLIVGRRLVGVVTTNEGRLPGSTPPYRLSAARPPVAAHDGQAESSCLSSADKPIGASMAGGSRPPPQRTSGRTAWLSRPAWTWIGSLVGILALAVALGAWWLPQSAESSTSSAGSNVPQPADTSAAQGTDAVMPPSTTDSAAPATTRRPAGNNDRRPTRATSPGRAAPPAARHRQLPPGKPPTTTPRQRGGVRRGGAAAAAAPGPRHRQDQHLAGTLGVDSSAPGRHVGAGAG